MAKSEETGEVDIFGLNPDKGSIQNTSLPSLSSPSIDNMFGTPKDGLLERFENYVYTCGSRLHVGTGGIEDHK